MLVLAEPVLVICLGALAAEVKHAYMLTGCVGNWT